MVKVMIVVAICTGLRASEILGLKWSDVDFVRMVLTVNRSFVGKHEDETKTPESQADVPMHEDLASVLMLWKGHLPSVNEWLFANPMTGRPYWRDSLQANYLKPAGLRIGVVNVGWHSFRHSYRRTMKALKMPLEVQKDLMRHADIKTTMGYGQDSMMEVLRPANALLVEGLGVKKLLG